MLARLVPATLLALAALAAAAPGPAAARVAAGDDPVVVISGDVDVARGERADGVYVLHGDVRVDGRVDGEVVAVSGDVVVRGTVDGDLYTVGGRARLEPGAVVTGDVVYFDERPLLSDAARVGGDLKRERGPDIGGVLPAVLGSFIFWLAITVSMAALGCLLLLAFPRAAEAVDARAHERAGPTIAIGLATFIALPVGALVIAFTLLGLPLALLIGLALLPLGAVAYVASAWALGRAMVRPPRNRYLAFLAGLAVLRLVALVPLLGLLAGLAALVYGLGLLGAAAGAARRPPAAAAPAPDRPAGSPGS